MYSQIETQLRARASWLMQGRYDLIASQYRFPLLVDLGGKHIVVLSAAEAMSMLDLQYLDCQKRGVLSIKPVVTALDLPQGGRFRIWVDWYDIAPPGGDARTASAIYYCRRDQAEFCIEMISYTQLSTPELKPHLAALALSA